LEGACFLPPVLTPLVEAAERGSALGPAVESLVHILGFDSFMYGTSLCARPDSEQKSYVFTTLSPDWVMRYDQRAYIELDPRILHTFGSAMPLVWDQRSERGQSRSIDAFLDDAAEHGIASGVSLAIFSSREGHVVVAYNSHIPVIDELRRFEIARSLGDLVLLGIYFHEVFMKTVIDRGLSSSLHGSPLSPQERRCLTYAAHGLTSRQIAAQLHISERMVELHFSHIRSKLGVANRQEAIAKAVSEGLVYRGEPILRII
jgi:LuxR family transcriptional activator of bioluminescence operon